MRINADFTESVLVIAGENDWVHSPQSGVERIMLDRIGEEVARATSIVRYAAGSSFARHEHAMGEEFLVLDGVFSDESGNFPRGTYVRNPPGSGHAPYSEDGCRILVKLRQFDADDIEHVVVDTNDNENWQSCETPGVEQLMLHRFGSEQVMMVRLSSGAEYDRGADGSEVFVVSGSVTSGKSALPANSWIREPLGDSGSLVATEDSTLWVKRGHLPVA